MHNVIQMNDCLFYIYMYVPGFPAKPQGSSNVYITRPSISVAVHDICNIYTHYNIIPVISVQLMTPGNGRNTSYALGDFHYYICDIWLFAAKGVVFH